GDGLEIAHIDLIIGEKDSPVGHAFATSMAQPSYGHTPMLGVIRPNLPAKPATLIVPKVTVRNFKDAGKIFGPAQAGVAKAVADAVEEGILPAEYCNDWVVIVSVFVHKDAQDYRKIYQYNYGATKLALKRALENYPSLDKVMKEKDRATHPIMGFRVYRLWNPPYLQVALDLTSEEQVKQIIEKLPVRERLLLEAGTPLIKNCGIDIVEKIRKMREESFIIADLKTLDVGRLEVKMAADATADAVCISGLGPNESIEKSIQEAQRQGIYSIVDFMNVADVEKKLKSLHYKPDIALLHRNVDVETAARERGEEPETKWGNISTIKKMVKLVSVAGGITPKSCSEALEKNADIIVVGRYIIRSQDPYHAARDFLEKMPPDPDTMRLIMDEDELIGT
ncbi:MAG: bifunctional 5,6,7,8-tetrahydromethanopterin hydro-lyase/3-hexulose-6-phosphate synthase, partial [Theionarchaea archaeon]|nr:bifunctional 5,6,7,8-tetrahydromethanopterin hydro-lyase/3-hexulose-6-phosphate synthase [Theionarchaea archaeon]